MIHLFSSPRRKGEGLRLRWPEADEESTYSRLVGGPNSTCVYIEEEDRLWVKDACHKG